MEMTLNEMIELIRQHHPNMADNEIRLLLNRASDDFCAKTDIIKHSFSLGADNDPDSSTASKKYYTLPSEVLTIREVYLNNVRIPRLIGKPIIDDTTTEEM
tara:strand:- start:3074 stop:3376 length:303 start_codon:yes stop_codon:yes gene_type:complete